MMVESCRRRTRRGGPSRSPTRSSGSWSSEGGTRASEGRRRDLSLGVQPVNRKVKGKRITTFIKAFRAACTKAGCPGRIPHDLRRTAVRNLVRAGIPDGVAMQMTGHKTRSVFERYNIVSECDLVEAARKLNVRQPAPLPPEGGSHTSEG
jgi:integrase